MKKIAVSIFVLSAMAAQAQLYGVGGTNGNYGFYSINTTTGAATNIFNFSVNGTTNILGLTYIPTTNRFVTTAQGSTFPAFESKLVEIDLGALSATVVSNGIPLSSNGITPYHEGLEYMASLGGLVVSHGAGGFFSGSLALLNPSGYGLISSVSTTPGLGDGDVVFMDGTGALNVMDSNNPTAGFMRNRVNNPFAGSTLTGFGSNMFAAGDSDFAWKGDEGRLFLTQGGNLATVNNTSTAISFVGNYGVVNSDGSLGTITGIAAVPEPGTLAALGLGALALKRRRRS